MSVWRELWARYLTVLRACWQARNTLTPPARDTLERAFLPAVLELQDSPPAPLPRVLLWTLVASFMVALLWSVLGRIDLVAVAAGKVIPSTHTKVIQPVETASVRRILVHDGQSVRRDDLLIELDATIPGADSVQARDAWIAARLERARCNALLAAAERGQAPSLAVIPEAEAALQAAEERVLRSQYEEHRSRLAAFEAELARRDAELASVQKLVDKLTETAPIARQRARDYQKLLDAKFVSRHGFLELEQARIEQERDLAYQRARRVELEQAVQETQKRQVAYMAEFRRSVADTAREAEQKIVSLNQETIKAEQKRKLMRLTAPVDGVVQQLAVHTEGGVVTPAQALMVIVPSAYRTEVEAILENKDVGFVKPGQPVAVKVETFPFTKYGTLPGKVLFVSSDAVPDEQRGLVFYARILLDRSTLHVDERLVNLTPGMSVTAEIKTGRRRLIEYVLSPVMQYAGESFRER